MSLNTQEKVRCPKCGAINDITLWQSVTADDSADLKEDLLGGRLNVLCCTECRARALVPTPLLYRDDKSKLLISLCPTSDPEEAKKNFDTVRESSRRSGELDELVGYRLRFVSDYNALMEKLLIFDSGLDDKTVEIIKLMVLMQEPDKMKNRSALFGRKFEDGAIEIMVQSTDDGSVFTSKTPGESYNLIHRELLNSGIKAASRDWEVIDRGWAVRALGGVNNSEE